MFVWLPKEPLWWPWRDHGPGYIWYSCRPSHQSIQQKSAKFAYISAAAPPPQQNLSLPECWGHRCSETISLNMLIVQMSREVQGGEGAFQSSSLSSKSWNQRDTLWHFPSHFPGYYLFWGDLYHWFRIIKSHSQSIPFRQLDETDYYKTSEKSHPLSSQMFFKNNFY